MNSAGAPTLHSRPPLERMLKIHQAIKAGKYPNASALAREFNVARRTVIRDLQELIRRGQLKPEVYPEWQQLGEREES